MSAIKYFLSKIFGDVSAGTIARTACFFLAILNNILVASGHSVIPISNETLEAFVTNGFLIASGVVAWWKNNSFTKKAIAADNYMKTL